MNDKIATALAVILLISFVALVICFIYFLTVFNPSAATQCALSSFGLVCLVPSMSKQLNKEESDENK